MPFPDICESSISFACSPDVLRTVYHSGNVRQRKLRQNRDDTFTVAYEVTTTQLDEFETFIGTINNGADSFTGPYYDGADHAGTCEIIGGEYNVSYIAKDLWSLSYKFEVKDRDFTDAENVYDIVNAYSGFENTGNVFEALAILINENELNA